MVYKIKGEKMKRKYEVQTSNEVRMIDVLNVIACGNISAYSYRYKDYKGNYHKYFNFRCNKQELLIIIRNLKRQNIDIERIGKPL